MEPSTTLPLDILACIIDLLAVGNDVDIKSLQSLSQACKWMVPLCRKHLFSSLSLCYKLKSQRFSDMISKNPDIARYVKSLDYTVYNSISDHYLNILDILRERSPLQSIKLIPLSSNDWNDVPESIRSSLVFLIQLPTVTHLDIQAFDRFPATALSRCSNLIDLQIGNLKVAPLEVNQVIPRSKIPTPVSLYAMTDAYDGLAILLNFASLHAGDPIVDFSRLLKATFDVNSPGDIGHINELVKATTRLQYLKISMSQPVELQGIGTSLAISAYRTLKLLALRITVVGDDYDPLCGLSHELRLIAGNNTLEELKLDVVVREDVSCLTESQDWSSFDSVLTESVAFPMLCRVSVKIWWYSYDDSDLGTDDVDDANRIRLESLEEDKFPRLVESKAVEFNFSAQIFYG